VAFTFFSFAIENIVIDDVRRGVFINKDIIRYNIQMVEVVEVL
jgi:hypothetical protein